MARAPRGPSVSDATELLALGSPARGRTRLYGDALRTFMGTLVIGMGLATAATVLAGGGDDRDRRRSRETLHAPRSGDPGGVPPAAGSAREAPPRPGMPAATATVASRPRARATAAGVVGAPTTREPPRGSSSNEAAHERQTPIPACEDGY
jgi:hypothetical protein